MYGTHAASIRSYNKPHSRRTVQWFNGSMMLRPLHHTESCTVYCRALCVVIVSQD